MQDYSCMCLYCREKEAEKALMKFNGRWYGGRQLQCSFSPVTNWKAAICGMYLGMDARTRVFVVARMNQLRR